MSSDRVLVVIGRTRHKMVVAELQEAVKRGAKFIELRLDFLAKAVDFKRLAPLKQCPWVATLRRPSDGGRFPGNEQERMMILRQAIVSGAFEWVDLETDIAGTVPRFGPVKRIVSYHNTTETPANLDEIYAEMLKQDADVYKLAVAAQSPEDVGRVLQLQRTAPKPTVAFCMGDIGQPTRFLALKFGAPWIYAAFNKERGIAPGLPSFDEFRTTYPVQNVNADTQVFGVLGDPVGHSLSPLLHNHMYKKLGVNALYLPFRVPRGQLPLALESYDQIPVRGYSVTIPHKEAAASLARESEPNVQVTASANTLVRRDDGKFTAANTDFAAAADSLKGFLAERAKEGPNTQLSQLSILILGAGGAARSIAYAFHREGAQITIAARTYERAQKLAEDVKCKAVDWHARHSVSFDVLINCTPVGMHPNVDESPCHFSVLKPGTIVFDTIYTPETTLLIREARARGCDTITGVDMFVRQAARQIELFTGLVPDTEVMRLIMRKALSPLTKAFDEETEPKDQPTAPESTEE
ncbi:shikimate dehydrogenase [Gemmata sp. G18]|uniref:Multifunctional fusion protein n=1 Tax=Gemmata palustris TaxID=2822762 RepID=A0ABS5BPW7_9BACT|nr:shikimate dehydrogenase [Gemmata palustris]MBP3955756.1 shikimate dehydrogenase [Gemmata palustris]